MLIAAGAGLLLALILVALGVYGAEQLTRPLRCDLDDTAERWGLPEPEHVWLTAVDGLRLSAWWFHQPEAEAAIIVCHGHGGNKLTNLWVAADLYPRYAILLLDLRGHGESGGDRTSVGFLERLDIIGAVAWVRERFGPRPVGVLGISMGAASAILAAADCPDIAAVVADSPFARLRSPVTEAICARGYPRRLSPVLAWAVCTAAAWLHGHRNTVWLDPIQVVDRIAPRPLLLIHGQADELIPVANAYALYQRAGEPRELWVVPEVGHARVAELEPTAYSARVGAFFDRYLRGASGGPARPLEAERGASAHAPG